MKVRVATWNINSIRIRLELLKDVVETNNLDVILLQETKSQDSDFPSSFISSIGMNYIYKGQKSYNGVAILSKYPIEIELDKLPLYDIENKDEEARYIEGIITVDKKIIRLASVYVPMGGSVLMPNETLEESERFNYKLNFYKRLKQRLLDIKQNSNDFKDELVFLGGDLNVAQEEIDLTHPKANDGGVGFHPLERNLLKDIKSVGIYDIFRSKYPNEIQYTWWDYRTKAFDRNVGWRLDYLLATENAVKQTTQCYVDMKTRAQKKTSDHAPLICEIEI